MYSFLRSKGCARKRLCRRDARQLLHVVLSGNASASQPGYIRLTASAITDLHVTPQASYRRSFEDPDLTETPEHTRPMYVH